ncbi:MAG: hypothetical protein H7Z13_01910 [Ferruginibacter sp.]|nr:hypothetical protein [Ferruginibacter sp.]
MEIGDTLNPKPTTQLPNYLMCYHLKTKHGNTLAVIDDNCGISKFYAIAETLSTELKINFINHSNDEAGSLGWDFKYKNQVITLHYNMFNGVSVFPRHVKNLLKENNAVLEIAHFLERRAY